jgi:predicted phosphoribosyltransferase
MQEDQTNVSDHMEGTLSPSPVGPRMAKVLVTAETGIFKNGQSYAKGSEALISLQSAHKFEAVGEVQIISELSTEEVAAVLKQLEQGDTPDA